jgi:hypothetical protein
MFPVEAHADIDKRDLLRHESVEDAGASRTLVDADERERDTVELARGLRIDELGRNGQTVAEVLIARLIDMRLGFAELSLLNASRRAKRVVNIVEIQIE